MERIPGWSIKPQYWNQAGSILLLKLWKLIYVLRSWHQEWPVTVILLYIKSFWINSMKLLPKGDYVQEFQKLTRFVKRMLTRRSFITHTLQTIFVFYEHFLKFLDLFLDIYRFSVTTSLSFLFQLNISLMSLILAIITLK